MNGNMNVGMNGNMNGNMNGAPPQATNFNPLANAPPQATNFNPSNSGPQAQTYGQNMGNQMGTLSANQNNSTFQGVKEGETTTF